jgi:DNA-nicking Smr family endonuclease
MMANRNYNLDKYLHGKNHHKRKDNRRAIPVHAFRLNRGNDSGYQKVNVHDLALHNAKNRIKEEIRDAKADRSLGVKIIHGHNGGTAIRDWVRSISLEQFMESAGIDGKVWFNDEGSSCISLTHN